MATPTLQESTRYHELVMRVRGEYREMPGLSLTIAQAQRLWAVDQAMCVRVFESLVGDKILRRTRRGRFIRTD